MKCIFFVDILDSLDDLLEILESEFFRKIDLFFQKFGQISLTKLHDKVEAFLIFLCFVHSGDVRAFR